MNAAGSRTGLEETSCTFSTTRHIRNACDWVSTCNSWGEYLTMNCHADEPLLSACPNALAEPRRSSAALKGGREARLSCAFFAKSQPWACRLSWYPLSPLCPSRLSFLL